MSESTGPAPPSLSGRCLLAVFAHPDDEAYSIAGTLAAYGDRGVTTGIVCATRGEAGRIRVPEAATRASLGEVREAELREVGRILGVSDISVLGYPDGALDQIDRSEAVGKIVRHIRRLRPEVVITFDEVGVYGHSDHIAVHWLTRAAFAEAGRADAYPEHRLEGLEFHAPRRLYASVIPKSVLARLMADHRAGAVQALPGGRARSVPFESMGTPDSCITVRVVLDDRQFERKLAAIRAHRTQIAADAAVNTVPDERLRPRLGVESFQLLLPAGLPPETDFFTA